MYPFRNQMILKNDKFTEIAVFVKEKTIIF